MRPSTLLALSAALCFFFLASASPDEPLRHADPFRGEFTEWTRTHAKSYSTEEFVFRLSVWRENKRFVEEHNRQNHSYSLGMNQFGDLTADEFRRIYTTDMSSFAAATAPITKEEEEYNATTSEAASPGLVRRHPASLDWRTWGGVQAVKNQGTFPPPPKLDQPLVLML
jgi:hypothetical protein